MALQKEGKYWHIKYRDINGKHRRKSTNESDYETAKDVHAVFMTDLKRKKQLLKTKKLFSTDPIIPAPVIAAETAHRPRRMLISEALPHAQTLKDFSRTTILAWERLVNWTKKRYKYLDELDSAAVNAYLTERYGYLSGKAFNNNKTLLASVFKCCLIESGFSQSPTCRIVAKKHVGKHQRPATEEEFAKVFLTAKEPWRTAVMIAWWTGMRKETVFNLKWDDVDLETGHIQAVPGKTKRFGRGIWIPIHAQLYDHLVNLPPSKNEYVLGFCKFIERNSGSSQRYFADLFKSLKIFDSDEGIICFNSFRNSFITRCDELGMPRHATRGMVGQRSDKMTDLYSHDKITPLKLLEFPSVDFDKYKK